MVSAGYRGGKFALALPAITPAEPAENVQFAMASCVSGSAALGVADGVTVEEGLAVREELCDAPGT